ncbi:hypothetical protein GCM10009796_12110 [Microbacterium koreense]
MHINAHSAMLGSFLELRITYIRVCVDMQKNPKSVESSLQNLKTSIDDGLAFWQHLLERSRHLKDGIRRRASAKSCATSTP